MIDKLPNDYKPYLFWWEHKHKAKIRWSVLQLSHALVSIDKSVSGRNTTNVLVTFCLNAALIFLFTYLYSQAIRNQFRSYCEFLAVQSACPHVNNSKASWNLSPTLRCSHFSHFLSLFASAQIIPISVSLNGISHFTCVQILQMKVICDDWCH